MKRHIIMLTIVTWAGSLSAAQPNNTTIAAKILPTVSANITTTNMIAETAPSQLAADGQTLTQSFQLRTNNSDIPLTLSSQTYSADNQPIQNNTQVILTPCQGSTQTTLSAQSQTVASSDYSGQGCNGKTSELSVRIPPQQVAPSTVEQQNVMIMVGSQ